MAGLVCDFRHSDPIAYRVSRTRRAVGPWHPPWFYLFRGGRAEEELNHAIEPGGEKLDSLPAKAKASMDRFGNNCTPDCAFW